MSVVLWGGIAPAWAHDALTEMKISRVAPGTAAAPFHLTSLDGAPMQLTDVKGKVVVVNFWATWCGPCKDEMPALERLRQKLDPERFALVTITTDLQREGIRQFLSSLHVQVPVLFDEHQEVSQAYLVRALPTTVLIDGRGNVVGRAVGPREWDSSQSVHLLQSLLQ